MLFSRLIKNQKGITLVELVMVMGASGILLSGISYGIYRVLDTNTRASSHMTAVKQVENAVHFISRDTEKAQFPVNTTAISSHRFNESPALTLSWVNDFDNASGSVTYSQSGNDLVRTYTDENGQATASVIAEYIAFDETNWSLLTSQTEGLVLIFNITATVNTARPASETRSFQIIPRSLP
jgi:type II secretory pathway pseudopilin PulG